MPQVGQSLRRSAAGSWYVFFSIARSSCCCSRGPVVSLRAAMLTQVVLARADAGAGLMSFLQGLLAERAYAFRRTNPASAAALRATPRSWVARSRSLWGSARSRSVRLLAFSSFFVLTSSSRVLRAKRIRPASCAAMGYIRLVSLVLSLAYSSSPTRLLETVSHAVSCLVGTPGGARAQRVARESYSLVGKGAASPSPLSCPLLANYVGYM